MSAETVRVIAHLIAQTEKVEELSLLLSELVAPVRQQSGCLQYDLWQNQAEPTKFVFVEEWESQALLDAHSASEIMQAAGEKMSKLLAAPADIQLYRGLLTQ